MTFNKKRILYSLLLSLPLAGLCSVPLFLLPFLGVWRFLVFIVLAIIYGRSSVPFVERLIVKDNRFSAFLAEGMHVAVGRLPHAFEIEEIEGREAGPFVFISGISGHIISSDGVSVWVEFCGGYFVTHANCLQPMPHNVVMHDFSDSDEEEDFVELDD